MSERRLSLVDQLIHTADNALRTLAKDAASPRRQSPAANTAETALSDAEKTHAAGLMRVNHSGEVCAQALYQGQALTAKKAHIRSEMERAADEEADHLAWCQDRLDELGSHTSVLNPIWYFLSFGIGAGAGLVSDRLSLGFIAATEEQVCKHLNEHLKSLPGDDIKSRTLVSKMLEDESQHAKNALAHGGLPFPSPIKGAMTLLAKAMTKTSYKI